MTGDDLGWRDWTVEGGAQRAATSRREAAVGVLTRGAGAARRLPGLLTLLEALAKVCAAELTMTQAAVPQLRLLSFENGAVRDVAAFEAGGSLAAILHLEAWGKTVSVLADPDCVFTVVELMCGGNGSQPAFSARREFTSLETRMSRLFFEKVATGLASVLAGLAKTEVHLRAVGQKAGLDALGHPSAPVVMAAFELSVIGRRGRFMLALPEMALEPVRKELSRGTEVSPGPIDPVWAAELEKEVTKAGVVLTAVLDELQMDLGDLTRLELGRILELKATPEPSEARGGRPALAQLPAR